MNGEDHSRTPHSSPPSSFFGRDSGSSVRRLISTSPHIARTSSVPTPHISRGVSSVYRPSVSPARIARVASATPEFFLGDYFSSGIDQALSKYPSFRSNFQLIDSFRQREIRQAWGTASPWLLSLIKTCIEQGNFVLQEDNQDVMLVIPPYFDVSKNSTIFENIPKAGARACSMSVVLSTRAALNSVCRYISQNVFGGIQTLPGLFSVMSSVGVTTGMSLPYLLSNIEGSDPAIRSQANNINRSAEIMLKVGEPENSMQIPIPELESPFTFEELPSLTSVIEREILQNSGDQRCPCTVVPVGDSWQVSGLCVGKGGFYETGTLSEILRSRILAMVFNKLASQTGFEVCVNRNSEKTTSILTFCEQLAAAGYILSASYCMSELDPGVNICIHHDDDNTYTQLPYSTPLNTGLYDSNGDPIVKMVTHHSIQFSIVSKQFHIKFQFRQEQCGGLTSFSPVGTEPAANWLLPDEISVSNDQISLCAALCGSTAYLFARIPFPSIGGISAVAYVQKALRDDLTVYPVFASSSSRLQLLNKTRSLIKSSSGLTSHLFQRISEAVETMPDDTSVSPITIQDTIKRILTCTSQASVFAHTKRMVAQLAELSSQCLE